eukprot:2212052-Alexandrium_andersonii.AAC.1
MFEQLQISGASCPSNIKQHHRNMEIGSRRSKHELRRLRNGLRIASRISRGVVSAPLFAQVPYLPTRQG